MNRFPRRYPSDRFGRFFLTRSSRADDGLLIMIFNEKLTNCAYPDNKEFFYTGFTI